MENKRRSEINRIKQDIRQINSYIQTDESTLERFRHMNMNTEYKNKQIDKLKTKNIERKKELEILEEKIDNVKKGMLDNDINEQYEKCNKEIKIKQEEKKRKKIQSNKEKEQKSVRSKAFYQTGRESDRNARYLLKSADMTYKYFTKVKNSIPDYILAKLKNMPNNKGYIWRGVYCYGEKPFEKGKPTTMFETKKGVLVIHETTSTEYKIWIKNGKSRRELKYSVKRNLKNNNNGTLGYN